jgi:stress response protein SCP2
VSHNPRIAIGEKRLFSISDDLTLGIDFEATNFDSFCFITNNKVLVNDSDLVFYNNLKDCRGILNEVTEDLTGQNRFDIEIKINVKELIPINDKIEIYLRIVNHKRKKTILNFFNKEKQENYISFWLLEKNGNEIANGEVYSKYLINSNDEINIKLLEFTKIRNDLFELFFSSEFYVQNIENIIKNKLKTTYE